jgi:two-component system, OmpR family, alkaline phosphatase synthesis response regulator PhoP
MRHRVVPNRKVHPMTKKVLLCDDEIPILRAAEFKIKKAGYDVRVASDGQAAWEMIEVDPPDVLVTDCQMPRLDGLELVERLRRCPPTRDLPVLMLTAKGFELSCEDLAQRLGIRELIAKPFSPRELLRSIERILQERPEHVELAQ